MRERKIEERRERKSDREIKRGGGMKGKRERERSEERRMFWIHIN